MRPPPPHRSTTAHLQAVYPFLPERSQSRAGPLIGRDLLGGPFCFDPWELYGRGVLTNPNALVLGQLGRGKSTFIKTLVWRQLAFGRRAWIVDPKGEYAALAEASGCRAVRLAPGGSVRLNPLDVPSGPADPQRMDFTSRVRPRVEVTVSLLCSSLGRLLEPEESAAVDMAVRRASLQREQPTLHHVVDSLLEPDSLDAETLRTDAFSLAADGRAAALELRRMAGGDLAGMFDGPTSGEVDLRAPVVVLDLSSTFSSPALPLIMTCATAWLQAAIAERGTAKRLVVVDEAWAILADLATARWTQAAFKLSRSLGVANVVVVHRISDLRAAGSDGSAQEKLAAGLLADSETRVVFGQPAAEARHTGQLLGLTRTETAVIGQLPRGVALWKVGGRSFLVEHLVGRREKGLVDTDSAMRDEPATHEAVENARP